MTSKQIERIAADIANTMSTMRFNRATDADWDAFNARTDARIAAETGGNPRLVNEIWKTANLFADMD